MTPVDLFNLTIVLSTLTGFVALISFRPCDIRDHLRRIADASEKKAGSS